MTTDELLAEIAMVERELAGAGNRGALVERLRSLHERAARRALGSEAGDPGDLVSMAARAVDAQLPDSALRAAAAHLLDAERHQWEIGSWASGAGEGLSSMREVRDLQLARAHLLAARSGDMASREEALRLLDEVERDPNRVAARRAHLIARLRAAIASE